MDSAVKAELLAGALGAAVFGGTFIGLNLPLLVAGGAAVGIYAGLNLIFGGKAKQGVIALMGESAALTEIKARIEHEEKFVGKVRKQIPQIPDPGIQQAVLDVCKISEKIFENFREDPDDLKQAQRFLIHFSKLWPIIENYLHLATDEDRRDLLTPADTDKLRSTLSKFVVNLKDAYRAFHENDLQQLRLTTSVLERMIDLDTKTKA
jgi:5-bromo-4-chloroindolyl phosphate hydrolysis protein